MTKKVVYQVLFFVATSLISRSAIAQETELVNYDSAYYKTYHRDLIVRIFSTRKYHNFEIKKEGTSGLKYRANNLTNIGAGVTYRGLSLNLAYGFDFVNPTNARVNTSRIDLQSRLYGRKWLIDLSGEFFKGYDLLPKGKFANADSQYYSRPDLDLLLLGFTAYRLFNSRQLTMRNGFVQDEWQRRSAGSFLAGGGIHFARVAGDSSIIPTQALQMFNSTDLFNLKTITLSVGVGYAYTLVLPANFYINGAITPQLNLASVHERYVRNTDRQLSLTPSISHKLSAGYFNGMWHVGAFWVNNQLSSKGSGDARYLHNTGIFRIVISKRISSTPGLKRLLRPADAVLNVFKRD